MSVPFAILAVAGALGAPNQGATALSCGLMLPDGSQFQLEGRFDGDGLHSNLSDLIDFEGAFVPMTDGIFITSDGTDSYRWQLHDAGSGQKFDASLTKYGNEAAVLMLERQRFVGRHWGRNIVGIGFCDVRGGQAGEKES
jgi:hypothetical protein